MESNLNLHSSAGARRTSQISCSLCHPWARISASLGRIFLIQSRSWKWYISLLGPSGMMDVLGSGIVSSGGISNGIHPSGGVIPSWGGLYSDKLIMTNGCFIQPRCWDMRCNSASSWLTCCKSEGRCARWSFICSSFTRACHCIVICCLRSPVAIFCASLGDILSFLTLELLLWCVASPVDLLFLILSWDLPELLPALWAGGVLAVFSGR